MGGVATRPWRLRTVEFALKGKILDEATLRRAAAAAVSGARSSGHNEFKIALAPKLVVRALMQAGVRLSVNLMFQRQRDDEKRCRPQFLPVEGIAGRRYLVAAAIANAVYHATGKR